MVLSLGKGVARIAAGGRGYPCNHAVAVTSVHVGHARGRMTKQIDRSIIQTIIPSEARSLLGLDRGLYGFFASF